MVNRSIHSKVFLHVVVFSSLLLLSDAFQFRNRRDAVNYVIDTLVIVDDIVFSKWVSYEPVSQSPQQRQTNAISKLKTYVSLVIHQSNDRLATLDDRGDGWSVQMSVSSILVNKNPIETTRRIGNTNQIDPVEALSMLRLWVVAHNYTDFDHIVLFSGETFGSSSETAFNNLVRGRGYVDTMCNTQGYSVSFVQEIGGFQNGGYVAHEIAHSLASVHDGQEDASDCSSADRYIMSDAPDAIVTPSNKENPWYFSACSSRSIGNFLATNKASCLTTDREPLKEFVDSKDTLPGLQYGLNEQCRTIYDSASRLCLGDSFGTVDEACTSMYCLDTSKSTTAFAVCGRYQAAEGTPCANGKLCVRGKCVSDSRAPPEVGVCSFGDSVTPINGLSCAEYISSNRNRCYDDNIRNHCCYSCENIKTEFEACPWGDRKSGCLEEYCRSIRPDGTRYDEDCCETCSYQTAAECVDVPTVEGMSCAQYIQHGQVQRCYDSSLAFKCCQSCAEQRNGPEGCEYGNQILGNYCASQMSSSQNCTDADATLCCQTCRDLLSSSPSVVRFSYLCPSLFIVIFWFVYALF